MSDEHMEESKKESHSEDERLGQTEEMKTTNKAPRSEEEQSGQFEEMNTPQEPARSEEPEKVEEEKKTRFIENPLPLPKPHKRKVLDFDRNPGVGEEDFDYPVDEKDDFDIK